MFNLAFLILHFSSIYATKSALEHFASHQKIYNYTLNVINNATNNNKTVWLEYNYNFKVNCYDYWNDNVNETVTIGSFENDRCNETDKQMINFVYELIKLTKNNIYLEINQIQLDEFGSHQKHYEEEVDVLIYSQCAEVVQKLKNYVKSLPIFESHYFMIYGKSYIKNTKDIFILTFVGSLWLCFLALLLLLAICLRITTKQHFLMDEQCEDWSWVDITLWTIAAACQQGLSNTPSKFSSCCIFLLGYLTAYLLYTGFAAGITSVLLQRNLDNHIDQELNYRQNDLITFPNFHINRNTRQAQNMEEIFKQVDNTHMIGIAPKYYINQYLLRLKNNNDILDRIYFEKLPISYSASLFLSKKSNLIKDFNYKILRLKETGLLKRVIHYNSQNIVTKETSPYSEVGFEHVGSAILLFLGGILASIFFLICEFLYAVYQKLY